MSNTNKSVFGTADFVTRCGSYNTTSVTFASTSIVAEIADTDCKGTLGLSGQTGLPSGTGMLFIFPQEGSYGFWMKDMKFALDMVWVRADFSVSGIEKNVPADSYPQTFGEKYPAQYVIELPAGFVDAQHLSVGEKISLGVNSL